MQLHIMQFQEIRFKHFASKDQYLSLLNDFILKDRTYLQFPKIEEPIDDLDLHIEESFGSNSNDSVISTYSLRTDFIIPGAKSLAENHIGAFKKLCNRKNIYSETSLKGFSIQYISYLREFQDEFNKAEFLDLEVITLLNEQMDLVEVYIGEFIEFPTQNIKTKIPLNWNQTDIAYFFYLLKLNEQIGDINWADLAKIIDNSFYYLDSKGHQPIVKPTRKIFSSFRSSGAIPVNSASERLKEIFSNPDFYNN